MENKNRRFKITFISKKWADMVSLSKLYFLESWMNHDFIEKDLKIAIFELYTFKIPCSRELPIKYGIEGELTLKEAHQKAIIFRDLYYLIAASNEQCSKEEIVNKYPLEYRVKEIKGKNEKNENNSTN